MHHMRRGRALANSDGDAKAAGGHKVSLNRGARAQVFCVCSCRRSVSDAPSTRVIISLWV